MTSSRVRCLRPLSWTSSPSPKSESESPVTIVWIDGNQMRSLSSRPAYALMPNGHAPGAWKCPSLLPHAARRGPYSQCRARGRDQRRTSQPNRARCPRAACARGGRAAERRARGRGQSRRRRSPPRAARQEPRAGRTTGSRHRARSRRTKPAQATTAARSSQDAARANARRRDAVHAWGATLSDRASRTHPSSNYGHECRNGDGAEAVDTVARRITSRRPVAPCRRHLDLRGWRGPARDRGTLLRPVERDLLVGR